MDQAVKPTVYLSIAAVERDTGLSKDTLRVWERRYGFPAPQRDQFGERIYPVEQVERLRAIRRLMDAGHRPGKIMPLSDSQLRALGDRLAAVCSTRPREARAEIDDLLGLVRRHDVDELRRDLGQRVLRLGLARFVTELAAPLIARVGESWARGQLEVFEEHLFTESMQIVLRQAIGVIPQGVNGPRVLLTTFPGEAHGMGLLMVEAILALEGCHCISLGVQTPILDIALASESQDIDVVVVSFSENASPSAMVDGLTLLRQRLSPHREVWAGGRCPALSRRAPDGVRVAVEFEALLRLLAEWREAHAG